MFSKLMDVKVSTASYMLSWGIILGYLGLVLFLPHYYILATYENLPGEWLQVGFYFLASIVSFSVLRVGTPYRWFFWMLGFATFYVAMEEISWGQQIFNWGSPEFFKDQNLQGETNLHNMIAGPYSTTLKDSAAFAIAAVLWGYGIVYPMVMRMWPNLFGWVERMGVPVPADHVWVFFFFAGIFEIGIFNFNEAEVAEMLIGSGLMMVALQHRQELLGLVAPDVDVNRAMLKETPPVEATAELSLTNDSYVEHGAELQEIERSPDLPSNRRFFGMNLGASTQVFASVVVGLMFSATMTSVILGDEHNAYLAKQRYHAGLESFGNRYSGYGAWHKSINLYLMRLEREPSRVTTRRNLAQIYYLGGWPEHGAKTLRQAAAIEEKRLLNEPNFAQLLHVSLAQTYELLHDKEKRQYHLEQAVTLAQAATEANPRDTEAFYALSHAYLALGKLDEALDAINVSFEYYPEYYDYRHLRHEIIRALEERDQKPTIAQAH